MVIHQLICDYTIWLNGEISVAKYGDYYELTTPFLDRYNDCLQVYLKLDSEGNITITDDGYSINNLISTGFKLKPNSKRKQKIERLIKVYSLQIIDNAIVGTASPDDFPQKFQQFIQVMLSIDDMVEQISENPKDFFIEDVVSFLKSKAIPFEKDFPLMGRTGSKYKYDFYFPKTSTKKDRFCKVFSKITKQKRDMVIFNWLDTQEQRDKNQGNSELYVLLNNINIANMEDIVALKNYDIRAICFSNKAEVVKIFRC